ncbi:MAG TPA: transcription antitermination factor NusB [Halanaerobiales bacterium]|mgnify:FL=1|nr:transcription antitermination factor NusB [Halanaerobiales bacterium]
MSKITRHQQRIWSLQILYSIDLKNKFNLENAEKEIKNIKEKNKLMEKKYYFEKLVIGIVEDRNNLDKYINEKAVDWTIERMAVIDRNILRLSLYEMEEDLVPVGVAINEAVELAKEYGDDKSSGFINGILART